MSAGEAGTPRLVVHVVHRFSVGGLENGIVNLVNTMSPERWRHAIIALTEVDAGYARRIERDDVQLVSLHKPAGQGFWLYKRVWQLLREWRPSVVHTRNLGTLEFQVPAWAAGVPARVHGEHGRDKDDVQGLNTRHQLIRRLYKPFVKHQIALGSELTQYLRQRIGVAPSGLTTICNGVDHLRFAPHPAGRQQLAGSPFTDPGLWVMGTVGRMQSVKAQTVLAQAFVRLVQQNPSLTQRLRLVMVGDGPLRDECQQILEQAGLTALAWLPGERSDVPDVMRSLDLFVLPSLVEGISNTILEAMSCGLPVLATDVGGNRDLVEVGVTGQLVPAGSVDALASGLQELVADERTTAAMGRAARLAVESRFSLPAMVSAYEGVYQRLLDPPKRG